METNDKRQQTRMNLRGYTAAIADGQSVFSGLVDNISLGGLCLSELPQKFELKNWKYTLVLSCCGPQEEAYKVTVCPCWRKKGVFSQEVGFKIAEAHSGWKSFIQRLMRHEQRESGEGGGIWSQCAASAG